MVAVDDDAVAADPRLRPHPVENRRRSHGGRRPLDAGPPVGERVVEVERDGLYCDRPYLRDRHPPSLSQARATV